MKKFNWLMLAVMVVCSFFLVGNALGAWTVTGAIESNERWDSSHWIYRVKISLLSDGTDLAEFTLSTYLTAREMAMLKGGMLWEVETVPGTEPDAAYTLAFDSGLGSNILDLAGLSVTAPERNDFSTDLGYSPIMWDDLQIDIGDIGSAADATVVYIYIIK